MASPSHMTGLRDLLASERGVYGFFIVLLAAALLVVGKIDGAQWTSLATLISAALIASKAHTTSVELRSPKGATP